MKILLLFLFVFLCYFLYWYLLRNKNNLLQYRESFTTRTQQMKPVSYPISVDKYISINNINDKQSLINYELSHFVELINQVKILANKGSSPLEFNLNFRPVTTNNDWNIDNIKPITTFLVDNINRLGNHKHKIKYIESKNICSQETETDIQLDFDMLIFYTKSSIDNKNDIYQNIIYNNTTKEYDIGKISIKVNMIIHKNNLDDDIFNIENEESVYYIKDIYVDGYRNSDKLPGENVTDFDKFWDTTQPLSNVIVDESILKDIKEYQQNELNNLTKELKTF
jgi:hypothetical protein